MLEFEKKLLSKGIKRIAGVDEAGRGPLAGPIVIAAVMFDPVDLEALIKGRERDVAKGPEPTSAEPYLLFDEINDSKKLTAKKREKLYDFIIEKATSYQIITLPHHEIDKIGVGEANAQGFLRAITSLNPRAHHFLTDHFKIPTLGYDIQTNITKGDSVSISIAAASILAKVHRDRMMLEFHGKYPQYGFDKHKGYGTKTHREAILEFGPCEIHRKSFEPTKSYLKSRS